MIFHHKAGDFGCVWAAAGERMQPHEPELCGVGELTLAKARSSTEVLGGARGGGLSEGVLLPRRVRGSSRGGA